MKIPLLLALLMLVSHAFAADANANARTESDALAAVAAEKIHPDLILLEKDLTRAQNEKKEGKLTLEKYSVWEADFRSRLSAAMERIPLLPVNQAAYACLVALLGERKEAHAALDQALEANPDNPVLLRTKGQFLLKQNDFAAAAEHGKQAWEKSGKTDKDALALYNTAKGRVAPSGAGVPSPTAGSTPPGGSPVASADDPSKLYKLPVKGSVIPGFTQVESQVIQETQQIVRSPQFAQLEAAYRVGRPAVVNIGGRVIQYEPDLRASGMTFFGEKQFYIGPEAFKSAQELHKTVLHELYRLATSQSAPGVSGSLASREADAAKAFADRGITVLNQ